MAKDIVLITGGSGMLAQHLIREMQNEWSDRVEEIRVVDKRPFRKILDYEEKVPIREFIVDIVEEDEIEPPLSGVTLVFHTAARPFEFGMNGVREKFMEDNFQGTKQLTFSMINQNVKYMVYTSDAFVTMDYDDCAGMKEKYLMKAPNGNRWLLRDYGESKYLGEKWLCRTDGPKLTSEKQVKVVAVRTTLLYGQGDNYVLPEVMRLCRKYGYMPELKAGGLVQTTYAGNAAQMHLLAADLLRSNAEEFHGEVFNCDECTPPVNFFHFIQPFVKACGYQMRSISIPYVVLITFLYFVQMFLNTVWLLFGGDNHFDLPNVSTIHYFCRRFLYVNSMKARLLLNYKPKYAPEEAMKATLEWWGKNFNRY